MSLGLFAPCSDPAGRTSWLSNCILGLGAKNRIFLPGSPNAGWPSNSFQMHPVAVFFLLTDLPLLSTSKFQKRGASPPLSLGANWRCQVPLTR